MYAIRSYYVVPRGLRSFGVEDAAFFLELPGVTEAAEEGDWDRAARQAAILELARYVGSTTGLINRNNFV